MKKRFMMAAMLALTMVMTPLPAFAAESDMDEAAASKMAEILNEADGMGGTVTMHTMPDGRTYGREVYGLGDGNVLIMEFEEGEDALKTFMEKGTTRIAPLATNGEKVWKDYGSRYFTAKSTVYVEAFSGNLVLENHYTLSKEGIDERYGVTSGTPETGVSHVTPGQAITARQAARTIGAEVKMYADYKVTNKVIGVGIVNSTYRLTTSVGYLSNNTAAGQVQVQHSWKLEVVG